MSSSMHVGHEGEHDEFPELPHVTRESSSSDVNNELSARRTGLSFQRTRLSADRTLMSVIRTSLSLIGFGFTIYQVFNKMRQAELLKRVNAPRNFGVALLTLGCLMLIGGIGYHLAFMRELRNTRKALRGDGLIHAQSGFPVSLTLLTAVALLVIGVFALLSVFGVGLFS